MWRLNEICHHFLSNDGNQMLSEPTCVLNKQKLNFSIYKTSCMSGLKIPPCKLLNDTETIAESRCGQNRDKKNPILLTII